MRRVVVTGGAGFIGAHVCRELLRHGVTVTVVDDLSTGRAEHLDGIGIDLRVGSVLDEELLADACAGAHSVVHLAALATVAGSVADPVRTHEVNVSGTVHVLRAAADAHVVVASSSAVYGDHAGPAAERTVVPAPRSPYAVSKLAAESYATAFTASYGQPTLALRLFNVFGPLQRGDHPYAAAVPAFMAHAAAGDPITIFGDGRQRRDFVFVGDVARAIAVAAVERRTCTTPVNMASGRSTPLLEVVGMIGEALSTPVAVRYAPERTGDIRDSGADVTLQRAVFPDVVMTPLRRGIRITADWVLAAGRA